jgi:hypothetical protein
MYQVCQAAAADPEVAELLADIGRQRRGSWQVAAEWLSGSPGFRPGLTADEARDILYALASPDMWRVLVRECGWSSAQWRDFARTTARARLLDRGPPGSLGPSGIRGSGLVAGRAALAAGDGDAHQAEDGDVPGQVGRGPPGQVAEEERGGTMSRAGSHSGWECSYMMSPLNYPQ